MTDYNVGLLQALIVFHAPYFLSEDQDERSMGNVFLGTVVNVSSLLDLPVPTNLYLDCSPNWLFQPRPGTL